MESLLVILYDSYHGLILRSTKGGQLVAALTCGALSGIDEGWRWMLGLALAPAIIQLLGFIFILPEVILTWQDTSKKPILVTALFDRKRSEK